MYVLIYICAMHYATVATPCIYVIFMCKYAIMLFSSTLASLVSHDFVSRGSWRVSVCAGF